MPQTALPAIINATITHCLESPMQNSNLKAKPHLALPPHRLPGRKTQNHAWATKTTLGVTDANTKTKALSPRCLPGHKQPNAMLRPLKHCLKLPVQNTRIKAKPHSALSPHCLPGHNNRCRARATKTRTARNSQCRKPMPMLGQNRVVSKLAVKTER